MDSEQAEQNGSKQAPRSKRTYRAPELRTLGTVRELTLSPGCKTNETSPPFALNKTASSG
jgi:hypothetical protein